jgi:hypothetical protein
LLALLLGRWFKSSDSDAPHYVWDEEEGADYDEDPADEGEYATDR